MLGSMDAGAYDVVVTNVCGSATSESAPLTVLPDPGKDCNSNGVSDCVDILDGTLHDLNENGFPDECEAGTPTVSEWRFSIMALPLLAAGWFVLCRRPVRPWTSARAGGPGNGWLGP